MSDDLAAARKALNDATAELQTARKILDRLEAKTPVEPPVGTVLFFSRPAPYAKDNVDWAAVRREDVWLITGMGNPHDWRWLLDFASQGGERPIYEMTIAPGGSIVPYTM